MNRLQWAIGFERGPSIAILWLGFIIVTWPADKCYTWHNRRGFDVDWNLD